MKIFTMSKTLTLNLATGPATLMYPKRARVYTPITRGRIENDIGSCIFCSLCGRRCPCYAISVNKESKEWRIDRLKCCICNLCVEVCPVKCLSTDNRYFPPMTERITGICVQRQELTAMEGE
jgi:formate hydrogenlyase subunit 6/NADH:ubiquinone oxidoreductase subunit I